MAWLAHLDAKAQTWNPVDRWVYRIVKWTLAGTGLFLWVMLWWQRSVLLGVVQIGIIGAGLLRELLPQRRR